MVPRGAGAWFVLEGPGWDQEHRQERGLPRSEAMFVQKRWRGARSACLPSGSSESRPLTPLFSPLPCACLKTVNSPNLRVVLNRTQQWTWRRQH